MIKQYILLSEYNWFVTIFYAVDCYNIDEIISELELIECSDDNLKKAYDNLSECNIAQVEYAYCKHLISDCNCLK